MAKAKVFRVKCAKRCSKEFQPRMRAESGTAPPSRRGNPTKSRSADRDGAWLSARVVSSRGNPFHRGEKSVQQRGARLVMMLILSLLLA